MYGSCSISFICFLYNHNINALVGEWVFHQYVYSNEASSQEPAHSQVVRGDVGMVLTHCQGTGGGVRVVVKDLLFIWWWERVLVILGQPK